MKAICGTNCEPAGLTSDACYPAVWSGLRKRGWARINKKYGCSLPSCVASRCTSTRLSIKISSRQSPSWPPSTCYISSSFADLDAAFSYTIRRRHHRRSPRRRRQRRYVPPTISRNGDSGVDRRPRRQRRSATCNTGLSMTTLKMKRRPIAGADDGCWCRRRRAVLCNTERSLFGRNVHSGVAGQVAGTATAI